MSAPGAPASQTVFAEGRKRARIMLIDACMPWLDASGFRLTQHRGELLESELAPFVAATLHPSAIVRDRDDESRRRERAAPAADLRALARAVAADGG